MKKILLLACFFLTSCNTVPPLNGFMHSLTNESESDITGRITLTTDYELPQSRIQNYLSTIVLFLTEQELKNNIDISFSYQKGYTTGNLEGYFNAYFSPSTEVEVTFNDNFDNTLTDPKDINYYTTVLTFDSFFLGVDTKSQIHLRQDEGSTKISYMMMTKPYKTSPFEYLGHTAISKMTSSPAYGTKIPLPDILK